MIVIQNYKNTDNITSSMLRNHLSHEVFDIFFEDYIDCKSHTRHIIYSVCTKTVLKTTSKPKNNIQQKNNNNRLTETKDRKLKIIKTWSKYQIRRQYLLEQSCGHYKKAPKTYKWVIFQSQRSFRSNTNNSNNTRFNKNTRHNFLFYILKQQTWNMKFIQVSFKPKFHKSYKSKTIYCSKQQLPWNDRLSFEGRRDIVSENPFYMETARFERICT